MYWIAAAAVMAAPKVDFYVATNGNDAWSGRLAAPNRARTDGPFATVAHARDAVRALRAGKAPRGAIVFLRGGTYYLSSPLRLTPEDSGVDWAPVFYSAYPGDHPVVSGGVRLSGWKVQPDGRWKLTIPAVQRGEWNFSQLWVNGQRRYRPRLPKKGYFHIADGLPPSPEAAGKGFDRFAFTPGDIRADWHALSDVEMLGFQVWTMVRFRIKSVDEAAHAVTFTGHTGGLEGYSALPKGNRYLIENVREALSEPGEFYLDRATGELTYIPVPGEVPKSAVVIAPKLDSLVEIAGEPATHKWVQWLTFQGLTFAHTNWNSPPSGNAFAQAEVNLGGAVFASGARYCEFERCRIEHTGIYAIDLGEGCKHNKLMGCELTDLGAGGVKIGLQSAPEDDERVASHNEVGDCVIAHCGRLHPAAVGVWIGHAHDNAVRGNEITDLYYTGVSVGWSWGYGRSLAHHNDISNNWIHQIGQGVLSDMGGIYTLGISPGTVLRANRINDVESYDYGGWGLYTDEGSTGILLEKNIVYRCKSAGFHQHYGRENILRKNIFALNRESQLMRTRAEDHLSFTFEQNIVYWTDGALLASNWSGNNYKFDNNFYWHFGKPFDFAGLSLEQWRAKGQDVHSAIADPHFVAPEKGDFRIRLAAAAGTAVPVDGGIEPKTRAAAAPRAFPEGR